MICERLLGFLLGILIESSCVNILPQITQMTQTNAAGCIISQRKTVCLGVVAVIAVLWFVCVNQRHLREILWFLVCRLIEYSHVNILPQIAQITQTNAAGLHYHAEKDRLFEAKAVLLFWVLSA